MDENDENLSVDDVMSHVHKLVEAAMDANDHSQEDRTKAQEYVDGVMEDVPHHPDMSGAVSTDVRDTIKKLMPSIMRTLLANDRIAEYEPNTQEQEEAAEQATNYVNMVALRECDAETAIHDAIYDAMVIKTGIIKWCAYQRRDVEIQKYTDQSDMVLAELMQDQDNEIMELQSQPIDDPEMLMMNPEAMMHSFTLKRVTTNVTPKLEAIKRERFLIDPRAQNIEEAELVGERMLMTRSDLVGMGYDQGQVAMLSIYDELDDPEDYSRLGDDWMDIHPISSKAMELVEVFEVFVRLDLDGDGVAEMHRLLYGDAGDNYENFTILAHEIVTEAPYASIVVERDAHQFEGHSITEDLKRVQQANTVLLRGLLDNTYAQAEPRTAYVASALENPQDVGSPRKPLALTSGLNINDALQYRIEPFVGDKLLAVMEFMDTQIKEKTGITDASGGLTPEALQNQTATATTLMSEAGFARADNIVRTIAFGLRKVFLGLLKLVIAHADRPRTMLVNGEFVEYDPRTWDAGMECTINIGLGGGTKERDLASLQIVLNMQKELIAAFGNDNPFVKPDQLYNTLQKITETTGLPSADPFFTKPDPEEIAMRLAQAAQQPDPETMKIQAQMALEEKKAETQTQREAAQLEADIMLKREEGDREERSNVREHERETEKILLMHEAKLAEIQALRVAKQAEQSSRTAN